MVYGKGRAQGYSDYYKNNSSAPDDEMSDTIIPRGSNTELSAEDKRKLAIKRRLQKLRSKES